MTGFLRYAETSGAGRAGARETELAWSGSFRDVTIVDLQLPREAQTIALEARGAPAESARRAPLAHP